MSLSRRSATAAALSLAALAPAPALAQELEATDLPPAGTHVADGLGDVRRAALAQRAEVLARRAATIRDEDAPKRVAERRVNWSLARLQDDVRAKRREVREARRERRAARRAAAAAKAAGAPVSASGGAAPNGHLQSIAACESGGNPSAVSPDGQYRGKYQFSQATWNAMGGSGDPASAPEAVQDAMAAKLYATAGPGQWPVCSR